jgi:hypothetical protein
MYVLTPAINIYSTQKKKIMSHKDYKLNVYYNEVYDVLPFQTQYFFSLQAPRRRFLRVSKYFKTRL